MKKLLIIATLISSYAFAGHGPAGCGLGSVIFKDQQGLIFNVLAATFNGSSGNQTFAMTTGTLGCEDAQNAKVSSAAFIQGNFAALSNDIAKGQGETLSSYLTIIGKSGANTEVLRKNFSQIFAKNNNVNSIDQAIKNLL